MERSEAQGDDWGSPEEYQDAAKSSFITIPPLSWGHFMKEQANNKYNGVGWETDTNAPQLPTVEYKSVKRYAHYQALGKATSTTLRSQADGYIDRDSIKVIRKDGKQSNGLMLTELNNGEYKVEVSDSQAEAIFYQTAIPVNWHEKAGNLSDEDFAQLDKEAYKYYTDTPALDLSKIRLQSKKYIEFTNIQELIDFLHTMRPFERVEIIREIIAEMRYATTERTESAFAKFHKGELPEKDFLEFAFNSNELEQPGDGDCDGQNSIAALLFRYAGIPSRLNFVFTSDGVGHGPTSIYLPTIGWVLADSMGARIVQESHVSGVNRFDTQHVDEDTDAQAQQRLIQELQKQKEFANRQCYKFL